MGWFWAETSVAPPARAVAPHPLPHPDAKPPPSCPMHDSSSANSPFRTQPKPTPPASSSKECPYAPPTAAPAAAASTSSATPDHASRSGDRSFLSRVNPLNLMPNIANERASSQTYNLSLDREGSSIPRGSSSRSPSPGGRGCPVKHSPQPATESTDAYADDGSDKWQYPSPQQMYNALLRKGYTDTDPTAIPAMVSVHNFLNEGAWAEILEWERRFHAGLWRGWDISSRGGEERSYFGAMTELEEDGWTRALADMRRRAQGMAMLRDGPARGDSNNKSGWQQQEEVETVPEPRLLKFEGRPNEMTPRARWLQLLGRVWPSEYSASPPFDRHDWYVLRHSPDGAAREVRYVIDYYSGPSEESEQPVFYLDVRPAIDGPTGFGERILRWGGDTWWRASGGAVRERSELEKLIQQARERDSRAA